jgi:hypothetical protein
VLTSRHEYSFTIVCYQLSSLLEIHTAFPHKTQGRIILNYLRALSERGQLAGILHQNCGRRAADSVGEPSAADTGAHHLSPHLPGGGHCDLLRDLLQ